MKKSRGEEIASSLRSSHLLANGEQRAVINSPSLHSGLSDIFSEWRIGRVFVGTRHAVSLQNQKIQSGSDVDEMFMIYPIQPIFPKALSDFEPAKAKGGFDLITALPHKAIQRLIKDTRTLYD